MNEPLVPAPVRLAFREEGEYINAYLAYTDSMKDAQLLGSIRKSVCDRERSFFEAFRGLMQSAMAYVVADATGAELVFGETRAAPEHERTRKA